MSKKLTIGQINKLPIPTSGFKEYSADNVPGLRVRVMSSGVRSWVFRYKRGGKNNVVTIGRVSAIDIKEAEQQARVLRLQVEQGQDPAQERRARKAARDAAIAREDELNPLFRDYARNEFIPKHVKRHTKTHEEITRYLERDVLPVIGMLRIQDIKRRDVVRVLDIIQERGAYYVSNRVRAVMSKAFTFAIQQGLLESNPVQYTAIMKEKPRDRVLSEDEIRLLWANTNGYMSKLALRFALLSGQRAGEVVGLKWENIRDGIWYMGETKNGHKHDIPVSKEMWCVLGDVRKLRGLESGFEQGFVFTSHQRGGVEPVKVASLMAIMRTLPWGDDCPRVHDLRRTAITLISMLGFNRTVQDKVANHVDSSVGGIYDRYSYQAEKLKALDALGAEVRRIVDGARVLEFPVKRGAL